MSAPASAGAPLRVLLVDDEPLARARLRRLVAECADPRAEVAGEAGDARSALAALAQEAFDVVLLDIHMPGDDGLTLARTLRARDGAPAVVFVTAHADHALAAFEVDALDYLTKPVRAERLAAALRKVRRVQAAVAPATTPTTTEPAALRVQERGRTELVPVDEVLYLKAELKYLTVRTATRSFILDGSLAELETRLARHFVRIHRNALVARRALRALERAHDAEHGELWWVRLAGIDERLQVSRRQLAAVRDAMEG
ncbi:MAG: LytTR family DNA-binding domain-containing protein [Rubrivivax sp.]